MSHDHLLRELDFVLTHPSCNVDNIESFYNSCLFLYDRVPLIVIVEHMRREKPHLLRDWSIKNTTVKQVLLEVEIETEVHNKDEDYRIEINTAAELLTEVSNGYYNLLWVSDIDENKINICFKRKRLIVNCDTYGKMELIGVKTEEKNKYSLYLKKREEKKNE